MDARFEEVFAEMNGNLTAREKFGLVYSRKMHNNRNVPNYEWIVDRAKAGGWIVVVSDDMKADMLSHGAIETNPLTNMVGFLHHVSASSGRRYLCPITTKRAIVFTLPLLEDE